MTKEISGADGGAEINGRSGHSRDCDSIGVRSDDETFTGLDLGTVVRTRLELSGTDELTGEREIGALQPVGQESPLGVATQLRMRICEARLEGIRF